MTIYAEEEFADIKAEIIIRISKNIRTWNRVLLRHRNTVFHDRNVMDATAFCDGGVALWGTGNIKSVAYRDNVLNDVPHCGNHPLADKRFFMDVDDRPHIACIVRKIRRQVAIDTFQ